MDAFTFTKFMLLVLALPAQHFICKYWSNDSYQQSHAIKNMVHSLSQFHQNIFRLDAWKKWSLSFVVDMPKAFKKIKPTSWKQKESKQTYTGTQSLNEANIEELAVEVYNYRKNLIHFARSSQIRSPRPSSVRYRVGQVIRHKTYDFYGVIVGWDENAKAPEKWFKDTYPDDEINYNSKQPHYLVLVDKKYQPLFTKKFYMAQEDIEVVTERGIDHEALSSYFGRFDGGRYLAKTFLNTVYPHDQ